MVVSLAEEKGVVIMAPLHSVQRDAGEMDARAKVHAGSLVFAWHLIRAWPLWAALNGHYRHRDCPAHLRRIRLKEPESGKTLIFLTNNFALPAATICALYKARWLVELFFEWIKAASSDQTLFRHIGERGQVTNLDRCLGLLLATDSIGHAFRENALAASIYDKDIGRKPPRFVQPVVSIRCLTGHYWSFQQTH